MMSLTSPRWLNRARRAPPRLSNEKWRYLDTGAVLLHTRRWPRWVVLVFEMVFEWKDQGMDPVVLRWWKHASTACAGSSTAFGRCALPRRQSSSTTRQKWMPSSDAFIWRLLYSRIRWLTLFDPAAILRR
jgi:hypothetical protein